MSGGVFTVEVRIAAAATQFTDGSPIVTFQEYTDLNTDATSETARILGFQYRSSSSDDVEVTLRRSGGSNADQRIVIASATMTSLVAQWYTLPGRVVPRQYGVFGTTIPPSGLVTTGETYQLFVTTANKASAATFVCWYAIGQC